MNKFVRKNILMIAAPCVLLGLCSGVMALEKPQRIALAGSITSMDLGRGNRDSTRELNDLTGTHLNITYDYFITESLGFGVGTLKGDSSDFHFLSDLFTDTRLEYQANYFGPRFQLPLSSRSGLYLNVSILDYDFDVIDDERTVGSDDGTGYSASFGWNFTLNNGIGFKVGYELLDLGDDVDITGVEGGIAYRF